MEIEINENKQAANEVNKQNGIDSQAINNILLPDCIGNLYSDSHYCF